MDIAEGYEVFCDRCYYDLWAARAVGVRNFYETAHFPTREAAIAWTHDPDPDKVPKEFN